MNIAEYFAKFDDKRIDDLIVGAPYDQGKEKLTQWVRGTIRVKSTTDSELRDLVITGPKLKVCFGGCKWNKVVFAMPKHEEESDPKVKEFKLWLNKIATKVKNTIWDSPENYKPGSKTNSRFTFDDITKPSSDPDKYPDELHCRLSTIRRRMTDAERNENDVLFDPTADHNEIVDADLFGLNDGVKVVVEPSSVTPRSYMIPVIRFAYSRQGDKFGLVLTITKAMYFPSENHQYKVPNTDWVLDIPDEEPDAKRPRIQGDDNV